MQKDANEILTRVGKGTPMGELFRRFWLPAALTSELQADGSPVRLRILCEDLVAFRDNSGKVGIVDAFCSHRLAPLFFGRNEEGGIRCPYHGWKFDADGQCVEMPNVGSDRDMTRVREAAAIKSYPTREAGGVVWIYMGPAERMPEFPHFEWTTAPEGYRHLSRWLQRTNWAQGMEGEIDTAHISWLHKEFIPGQVVKSSRINHGADGAPSLTLRETDYGFVYGARRTIDEKYLWRVTQWMLPMFSLIPKAPDEVFMHGGGRAWVPIDDNHVTTFCYWFRVDRPYNEEELSVFASGALFPPRLQRGTYQMPNGYVIDTFLPVANKDNDYLIDRAMQKTVNFSGIMGANEQDRALQECMGTIGVDGPGIVDRSREHLVGSDLAIVTARRRLIKLAEDLQNGIEPSMAVQGKGYCVRAISRVSDIADFDELMRQHGDTTRAPAYPTSGAAAAPARKAS